MSKQYLAMSIELAERTLCNVGIPRMTAESLGGGQMWNEWQHVPPVSQDRRT